MTRFLWSVRLVSLRVALVESCVGRTVVGPVLRLLAVLVVGERIPVAASAEPEGVLSRAVPASLSLTSESLTNDVPSTRQNTSASSISTRWHWGQRFMANFTSI